MTSWECGTAGGELQSRREMIGFHSVQISREEGSDFGRTWKKEYCLEPDECNGTHWKSEFLLFACRMKDRLWLFLLRLVTEFYWVAASSSFTSAKPKLGCSSYYCMDSWCIFLLPWKRWLPFFAAEQAAATLASSSVCLYSCTMCLEWEEGNRVCDFLLIIFFHFLFSYSGL